MFNLRIPSVCDSLPTLCRFGSHYDVLRERGRENWLLYFAKQKLLDGKSKLLPAADEPGSLACLCVRFALEFDINPNERSRAIIHKQIERHMRLCIAATTGFDVYVTIAGSEPLLAEAAFELIRGSEVSSVRHLANHSDLNCVDRGRRGELVAALIIMQARDISLQPTRRWISVGDFLQALLPSDAFNTLRTSRPTFLHKNENQATFDDTFAGYAMWFNHVIKIEDSKLIAAENLWRFITRGAMIMCTHNQLGVDIVLPVCVRGGCLGPKNVTAILIQVKNSKRYGHKIDKTLFNAMDPFSIGLFPSPHPDNLPPKPIIRMVFALALDEECGVLFPSTPMLQQRDNFTAFDIWCAGLSSDTFRHIGDDLASYRRLLELSLQFHDTFKLKETKDAYLKSETRAKRGLLRRTMAALTNVSTT
jgi:hypothetical protein